MNYPEIVSAPERVETIARGPSIRDRRHLAEKYGEHRRRQWRKKKGFANVKLPDDTIWRAEIHWYEAHGIGQVDFKVKGLLFQVSAATD